jgi:hypothetical protein
VDTVADLKPAPYNPRTISPHRLDALRKSMMRFGYLSGIVYNRRTKRLVGGHQRAKHFDPSWQIHKTEATDKTGTVASGYVESPDGRWTYREVDWDEATEKAANVAANAAGGDFNNTLLKDLVIDLSAQGFDLDLLQLKDLDSLLESIDQVSEDDVPDIKKDCIAKTGDLWVLGNHRILCGDSTDQKQVDRLFEGSKADMVLTDPPYGVSYVGRTKDKLKVENDNLDEEELATLVKGAFDCAEKISRGGHSGMQRSRQDRCT